MDIIAHWEKAERLRDEDDALGKERKELVGRYIQEPAADGYAIYTIVEVAGDIVYLEHSDIGDAWTIPMIESMGRQIPVKYAMENIERRDRMAALFPPR